MRPTNSKPRVLVAGIGGASLGTEVVKCLQAADRFDIFGCDISDLAYGHFCGGIRKSFVVDVHDYSRSILKLCIHNDIQAVIPGGEQPMLLLRRIESDFRRADILLAMNNRQVVDTCVDKKRVFETLKRLGIPIPWTIAIDDCSGVAALDKAPYPCVLKPATDSGGSHLVCLAENREQAELQLRFLLSNTECVVVQEYLPHQEGEFTIGVLSAPDGAIIQSTVLKRLFHTKLSTKCRCSAGVISSGYSQGFIGDYPDLAAQAERISSALGSTGPLNIQARVRNGELIPFEINPRFSASTYLRTLAGFNEVDVFLGASLMAETPRRRPVQSGYYLRSFAEAFAPRGVA